VNPLLSCQRLLRSNATPEIHSLKTPLAQALCAIIERDLIASAQVLAAACLLASLETPGREALIRIAQAVSGCLREASLPQLATLSRTYAQVSAEHPDLWRVVVAESTARITELPTLLPTADAECVAEVLVSVTARSFEAPALFRAALPGLRAYFTGRNFAGLPAFMRASLVKRISTSYAKQGVVDTELVQALVNGFESCLTPDSRTSNPARIRSMLSAAAYHLAALGAVEARPLAFDHFFSRERGALMGDVSRSKDVAVARQATQLFHVYAGLCAVHLSAHKQAPGVPRTPSPQLQAPMDGELAAALHVANLRLHVSCVSVSQRKLHGRLKALARTHGWPQPLLEAQLQCGTFADVVLTAKGSSRLMPAHPRDAAEALLRLVDRTTDSPFLRGASMSTDPVVQLLAHPAVSGIIVEMDGPAHYRALPDLTRLKVQHMVDALVRAGVDRETATEAAAIAPPNTLPRTSQQWPGFAESRVRLASHFLRGIARAYGWVVVSISHLDYGQSFGFVSTTQANAFLLEILRRKAREHLEVLHKQ
jgi:hypothetical protein